MALNLISSYGSDDESDYEEPTTTINAEDEPSSSSSALLSAETSNSDEDSSTESEADSSTKKKEAMPPSTAVDEPPIKKKLLPSAAEAFSAKKSTGVLVNQYERAVLDHEAMLSRHVPLTDPKKHKPICKAFQRGQCKRGKNCRYDHPPQEAPTPDMKKAVSSAPVQYTTHSPFTTARHVLPSLKAQPVLRTYPSY